MKPTLQKLYDGMPDHALSLLAMGAVLRNDDREMLSIGEAIGKRDGNARINMAMGNLRLLAALLAWEADFWRAVYHYSSVCLLIAAGKFLNDVPEKEIIAADIRSQLESHLAAKQEALRQWCVETGLDFDEVAASANLGDFPIAGEFQAEKGDVDEVLSLLRQVTLH